jgi:DNA helicase-4
MNTFYIEEEKAQCIIMLDNIEGKALDQNQRNAVVNDDAKQLVVAGAGSGKTLTISAKVKYLIERKGLNPKDILLISFTKKAAKEMEDRIRKLGIDVESLTFHKYGLGIISKVERKTPKIYDDIKDSIDLFLKDVIFTNEEDAKNYLRLLGILMLPSYKPSQSFGDMLEEDRMFDLTTLKGMYESKLNVARLKKLQEEISKNQGQIDILNKKLNSTDDENEINEYRSIIREFNTIIIDREERKLTIRNEKVKSREEVKIANLLFLDGIPLS